MKCFIREQVVLSNVKKAPPSLRIGLFDDFANANGYAMSSIRLSYVNSL